MSFRRRPYPEVLESMLTSLLGGVASETHPFPPGGTSSPPFRHILCETSVEQVFSVWGTLNGAACLFKMDADYRLLDDKQTIEWSSSGEKPDAGTLVHINYRTKDAVSPVSDVHTGSVVRTLAESISLEIAQLYANLEMVYRAGFIDTAEGTSLDKVVALLGVERIRGGRPVGKVQFTRAQGNAGAIALPSGTRIRDEKGKVEYETLEEAEMGPRQNVLIVPARDLEANDPVAADTLVILPKPIAGIGNVTNPAPTVIITRDETDEALRDRAKSFLHGSERATVGAIETAIANQGVSAEIQEYSDGPGTVGITLYAEDLDPEVLEKIYKAIDDSRPAGVRIIYKGVQAPLKVDLSIRLVSDDRLMKTDLRAAHRKVVEKLREYFSKLPIKANASINQMVSLVLQVQGIKDFTVCSATVMKSGVLTDVLDKEAGCINLSGDPTVLENLKVADSNLPTSVIVMITHKEGAALPDKVAIGAAVTQLLAKTNQENDLAKSEDASPSLGYAQLRQAVVLPGEAGSASLYTVQFFITQASGLAVIMPAPGYTPYKLQSGERMVLEAVTIAPEK